MFTPKLDLVDQNLKMQIFKEALEIGATEATKKYHQQIGMSYIGLYTRLKKYVNSQNAEIKEMTTPGRRWEKPGKQNEKVEKKLSKDELELLDRLGKGTVGITEMSNLIAVRVFEKMLKNPDDFRFLDFFRTQLLKIKETEAKNKEKWGNELLEKMFAGKLPPPICPKCGENFMETEVSEGELIDLENNESLRLTEST